MRIPAASIAVCCLAVGLVAPAGCERQQLPDDGKTLADARSSAARLEQENRRLRAELTARRRQVQTLQALGDKRLEKLYHVERISLGRFTGGVDLDGVSGDDAIRVYVEPIDQDGSVIKAAGEVKVQLFDLAAGPAKNLVAEFTFPVEQLSKRWFAGLGGSHFSLDCPWPAGPAGLTRPPAHSEITVRVQFTEYLTGKVFTAQKLCRVHLPQSTADHGR